MHGTVIHTEGSEVEQPTIWSDSLGMTYKEQGHLLYTGHDIFFQSHAILHVLTFVWGVPRQV